MMFLVLTGWATTAQGQQSEPSGQTTEALSKEENADSKDPSWRTELGSWSRNPLAAGAIPEPPFTLSWEKKISDAPLPHTALSLAEGMIAIGIQGEILLFNPMDGKMIWSQTIPAVNGTTTETSIPLIRNRESTILTLYGRRLTAFDCFTGENLSSIELPWKQGARADHLELPGQEIYLDSISEGPGATAEIHAFQAESGKMFRVSKARDLRFLLPCRDGLIWGDSQAVRISAGGISETICSLPSSPYWCGNSERAMGTVFYQDSPYMLCINFQYQRIEWERELPEKPDYYPVLNSGRLYFTAGGSRAYCLDQTNGKILWIHQSAKSPAPSKSANIPHFRLHAACDEKYVALVGGGAYTPGSGQ